VVVLIADYFKFNFLPAFQRFFHQHLGRIGESAFCQRTQFCLVFADTATHTAQCVCGTDHDREADLVGCLHGIFQVSDSVANRSFYCYLVKFLYKQVAVFRVHDRFDRSSQYLYTIFGQCSAGIQFGSAVQSSLSAKSQQDTVRLFFFDHFFNKVRSDRQEIHLVGYPF